MTDVLYAQAAAWHSGRGESWPLRSCSAVVGQAVEG